MLSGTDLVMKKADRTVVIRDQDIDRSVVVNVAKRRSATNPRERKGLSADVAGLLKSSALALIMEQKVLLSVWARRGR